MCFYVTFPLSRGGGGGGEGTAMLNWFPSSKLLLYKTSPEPRYL